MIKCSNCDKIILKIHETNCQSCRENLKYQSLSEVIANNDVEHKSNWCCLIL